MAITHGVDQQEGPREAVCPRCEGECNWRFLDEAKSLIEVMCLDCGRFEIPRLEFERAESDIVEPEERRE